MPRPRKDRLFVSLPPPPTEFPPLPLAQAAERYLRLLVLDGPLGPGMTVRVEEIAQHLGISRQPIRDAATRLASDGMLEIVPQVGCRVPHPIPSVVADFFRLFAAAEAVVVRFGAERRTLDEAHAFEVLARTLEAQASAAGAPGDFDPRYRIINRAFYDALHHMARSPDTTATAESLWDRSDFYIRAAFGSLYFPKQVHEAHRQIAAAVVAGDGAAAERITRLHLETVGRRTSEALSCPQEIDRHRTRVRAEADDVPSLRIRQ
jgi:DNA-binding GntR family transcriptional regulator